MFTVYLRETRSIGNPLWIFKTGEGRGMSKSPKLAYEEARLNLLNSLGDMDCAALIEQKVVIKRDQVVVKFQPW